MNGGEKLMNGGEDIMNGDDLYNDGDLHGYNKISPGCGKSIQLEDPNKKELLVRKS